MERSFKNLILGIVIGTSLRAPKGLAMKRTAIGAECPNPLPCVGVDTGGNKMVRNVQTGYEMRDWVVSGSVQP